MSLRSTRAGDLKCLTNTCALCPKKRMYGIFNADKIQRMKLFNTKVLTWSHCPHTDYLISDEWTTFSLWLQLINALASVLISLFVQCHGSGAAPIISTIICFAAQRTPCCITRQEACCQTHVYSTLMSYMLNKLCTYCTHYASVNTSVHLGGLCTRLCVQPACTQSYQPLVASCCVMHGFSNVQSGLWW